MEVAWGPFSFLRNGEEKLPVQSGGPEHPYSSAGQSEELWAVVGLSLPLEAVASGAAPPAPARVSISGVSGSQAHSGVLGGALRPRSGLDCGLPLFGWAGPALPCLPSL